MEFGLLVLGVFAFVFPVLAQKHELTLSLGGIPSQSRSFRSFAAGSTQISSDVSLGTNYGHRFLDAGIAALYGEIEFVALPNRSLSAATAIVPQTYASLYITPGYPRPAAKQAEGLCNQLSRVLVCTPLQRAPGEDHATICCGGCTYRAGKSVEVEETGMK